MTAMPIPPAPAPLTAPPSGPPAIEMTDLRVDYGNCVAVDDVSLTVPPGEIFGLVGPNGAGKTSTFRVLATLMKPTYGEVRLAGIDILENPREARRIMGYMPDLAPVPSDMKAWEFLDLSCESFLGGNASDRRARWEECLEQVQLADRGNGVYAHIDSLAEARRVLGTQVQGALFTVAKDLKIQVEFNPHIVASYRLLGYDNRRLANADFANDAKDAGDVGAGHTVTALYEIEPVGAELLPAAATATTTLGPGELARVRLRYKEPQGQTSQLVERSVAAKATPFATASADLRFAYGVAAFAMLLQRHLPAAGMSWEQVRPIIAAAVGTDAERHALLSLFDDARQIAGAPEVH